MTAKKIVPLAGIYRYKSVLPPDTPDMVPDEFEIDLTDLGWVCASHAYAYKINGEPYRSRGACDLRWIMSASDPTTVVRLGSGGYGPGQRVSIEEWDSLCVVALRGGVPRFTVRGR